MRQANKIANSVIPFGLWAICNMMVQPAQAQHSKYIQAVDEYVPAPGQFVNEMPKYEEGDTPASMASKCTSYIAGDNNNAITLGAYGGYVTFHFDHPITNVKGQKDFAVWGNAFINNAEPAIVLVSQDENHNGLPDDAWYELRGSEYDNPLTIHDYQITYTYKTMESIPWADNQDQSGKVARNSYHDQEYFPLWLTDAGSLTFKGACLPKNAYFQGGQFFLPAYEYGYADNQPNDNVDGCSMDIDWAVDASGTSVQLTHIDFVRCYNAMNQSCGWIGETSTEITGAEDLHLEASLAWQTAINTPSTTPRIVSYYSLDGKPLQQAPHGLCIVKYSNGNRKILHVK